MAEGSSNRACGTGDEALLMSLKQQRILIRLAFHGAVVFVLLVFVLITAAVGAPGVGAVFGLLLIAYLATMRVNPIPRRIEQERIRQHRCTACGAVFDLVGTWNCRCGFVSWQPRHAFAPCPHCHGSFAFLRCPRCEQGAEV